MEVLTPNNVKIYNLSCGKYLPDWITERRRRLLQKKDVGIRKRIELIQDFEMPSLSTGIKLSNDGQYILAVGIYKPRVRCFEVNNLAMKFDRCFDHEAVQFLMLSPDYSKIAFLQNDRNVEIHTRAGRYGNWRIPRSGRDMAYSYEDCSLYFVGDSSQVYRYNLELGRFLPNLDTNARSINKVKVNADHNFLFLGTNEGKVEAWDSRSNQMATSLDVALSSLTADTEIKGFPSVTSLNFKDGLLMAVGTATGQVLLYDIRSSKPLLLKDHMYGLPVKNVEFIRSQELVVSMDAKCVRFWNQNNGKHYTAIQPPFGLNDMCLVPNTGMLFFANEDKKMLTYFIPSIGPAPKWCYFLDNITEELEESPQDTVYDDYKFVTRKELEELGLERLIGTDSLRASMHGFFIDIRLYNKVKALSQPTTYNEIKKKKINEKIDGERISRVKVKKLPSVNKDLARKLLERKLICPGSQKDQITILGDDRFKAMFEDPEYAIDPDAEEYDLIRPFMNRLEKSKNKKLSTLPFDKFEIVEDEKERFDSSSSEEEINSEGSTSEVDMHEESTEGKQSSLGKIRRNRNHGVDSAAKTKPYTSGKSKPKFYEIKESEKFSMRKKVAEPESNVSLSLEERLKNNREAFKQHHSSSGNKVFTFTTLKSESQKKVDEQAKAHSYERARFRRSARHLRK